MAERLNAHPWKGCIWETVSRVRIPLSPPRQLSIGVTRVLNGILKIPLKKSGIFIIFTSFRSLVPPLPSLEYRRSSHRKASLYGSQAQV
jgi:hypothetical protein